MNELPYPPPFQDLATLSKHVCLGESTIETLVSLGMFPPPRKVRGKRLWRWTTVERFLAGDVEAVPTSPDAQAEDIKNATRKALQKDHA